MEPNDAALRERIKAFIVQGPRLKIVPSEFKVDPASRLGLDSIGVLERIVDLEKGRVVTISGRRVLRSVTTIAEFVNGRGRTP